MLEVTALERSEAGLPCVRVKVELHLGEFSGLHDGVWLDTDSLRVFRTQLQALQVTRRGGAAVVAMSPDEFRLNVDAYDTAGHLSVTVQLERNRYEAFGHAPTRLIGAFEMHSEYMAGLIGGVNAILGFDATDAA